MIVRKSWISFRNDSVDKYGTKRYQTVRKNLYLLLGIIPLYYSRIDIGEK